MIKPFARISRETSSSLLLPFRLFSQYYYTPNKRHSGEPSSHISSTLPNDPSIIPEWNGLVAVYKPVNFTSHDVVMKVRNILRNRLAVLAGRKMDVKVGHGGTLDPMAEGVLVLGIGKGTKQLNYYLKGTKSYQTIAQLGTATDTLDTTGEVIETKDASHVTEELLQANLPFFRGEIQQIPPMYSALKVGGRKLYDLARKGIEIPREARAVTVYRLEYLKHPSETLPHSFCLDIECSGGFYVRTLIDDLAKRMNTAAHMKRLIRTKQGIFTLNNCLQLSDWTPERIEETLIKNAQLLRQTPME